MGNISPDMPHRLCRALVFLWEPEAWKPTARLSVYTGTRRHYRPVPLLPPGLGELIRVDE